MDMSCDKLNLSEADFRLSLPFMRVALEGEMSYTLELRKDISSVVATMAKNFDMATEYESFSRERYELFERSTQPLYYIISIEQKLTLDDIIKSANALSHGQYGISKHPNFKKMMVITSDLAIVMAAKGLSSDAFGNMPVEVFAHLEDAVAAIRAS